MACGGIFVEDLALAVPFANRPPQNENEKAQRFRLWQHAEFLETLLPRCLFALA